MFDRSFDSGQNNRQHDMRSVLLLGFALSLFVVSCSPTTKAPKINTEMRLKNIERVMRFLEESNHATIGEQLQGIAGGATAEDKWQRLLEGDAGRLEMEIKDIREWLCHDGWGNRFNVEFKANLAARGASTNLLNTPFDLVLWSSGANKSNEFGYGDDLTFSKQELKRHRKSVAPDG